jgi:uncharacterized damage-inducible protein DinB
MTPEQIRLLYDYDAWANRRILDACAPLTPEQFTRDLGSSFPSVRDTVGHILGAQCVWLDRFQGRVSALPSPGQFADLASLRARWAEVQPELLAYVGGLSAADLDGTFEYRTPKGEVFRNVRWQTLQHLANHGSYHRGQVTTMLRQLGASAVSTDLIRFYRESAAQAAR